MRVAARFTLALTMILLIELIIILSHIVHYIERATIALGPTQQPRLTTGVMSCIDRCDQDGHDPPGVGGVRSIEQRHEPIRRVTG